MSVSMPLCPQVICLKDCCRHTGDAIKNGDEWGLQGGDHMVQLVLLGEESQSLIMLLVLGQLDHLTNVSSSAESLFS